MLVCSKCEEEERGWRSLRRNFSLSAKCTFASDRWWSMSRFVHCCVIMHVHSRCVYERCCCSYVALLPQLRLSNSLLMLRFLILSLSHTHTCTHTQTHTHTRIRSIYQYNNYCRINKPMRDVVRAKAEEQKGGDNCCCCCWGGVSMHKLDKKGVTITKRTFKSRRQSSVQNSQTGKSLFLSFLV